MTFRNNLYSLFNDVVSLQSFIVVFDRYVERSIESERSSRT